MKITIIGWYGTETIGDRAILTGLFSFFKKSYDDFQIKLGSLYPFFSQRSINEDHSFYKEITTKDIKIEIFDSKKSTELNRAIEESDMIAMGGGPLMDLNELFMVEYAFKKARQLGKKTALLGCGVGPLFYTKYKKSVLEISKNSDLVILRDTKSKDNLLAIANGLNRLVDSDKVHTSFDPAVECVLEYNKQNIIDNKKYIAVNLRDFPLEYNKDKDSKNINDELIRFINGLSENFSDKVIKLIPMHYFHIGGDDRVFLNKIGLKLKKQNISVQNTNMSLKETIKVYQNAYFNVGMRFHSVVLQTIASGKNYVLDYTEPKKGKISGFLNDIDRKGFFNNRYISLQEDEIPVDFIKNTGDRFIIDNKCLDKKLNIYIKKLQELQQ